MASPAAPKPHVYTARIDLPSAALASVAAAALAPAGDLRPALVETSAAADGAALVLRVAASELRLLRAASLSALDLAAVALSALAAFADDAPADP